MYNNWKRGRVREKRRNAFGYEVRIELNGVGYDGHSEHNARWIPLTSYDIDLEQPNDCRVYDSAEGNEELPATEENVCQNTSWNGLSAYSRVENALCDQILREGEDRFGRHLKSRRKRKAGKGKGKQERSNADALQSRKRIRRKRKKYVKSITHRVYV